MLDYLHQGRPYDSGKGWRDVAERRMPILHDRSQHWQCLTAGGEHGFEFKAVSVKPY